MTSQTQTDELYLVRRSDGLEIDLGPLQGLWSVEQYLAISGQTNHLLEFTDGEIEVMPMPTKKHQAISLFLLLALLAHVRPRGGAVFYAPLRVEVRPRKFREPDLILLIDKNDPRARDEYWIGADLVVEIVSPDDPARDTLTKRADYAEAGIPEYWIVNPIDDTITVLTLVNSAYIEHGVFRRGDVAASMLLAGFAVPVDAVLDAE
jgi:Uma2 family endonuclease